MSYILDALKKSEKERKKENSPSLHSVHGSTPGFQDKYSRKKTTLALRILAAISLGLTLGFSYYIIQQKSPVGLPMEAATPSEQVRITPQPPSQTPSESIPAPLVFTREKRKRVLVHDTTRPLTSEVTFRQADTRGQSLPSAQQLPEEIQRNIPEITLAGHTYSETPRQRMVIINNQILREGNTLDGNIRLVEITWDGVVLDYNGTEFQQNIK